jgi:putative oxygen-independent coproporphyrinogen III oxidase
MPNAVYLHIPFCEQICHYCDFNKVFLQGQPVDDYLESMKREIANTVREYPFQAIKTVYVGGGTPTTLTEKQLESFLQTVSSYFELDLSSVEFTVEANPAVTDRQKLEALKASGVNRLSIGVQAFQNGLLSSLNRNHRQHDVFKMLQEAREAGFNNISIDLMFGLPNQTMDMFQESLQFATSLNVEHISAYSLQVERKTVFYNRAKKGSLELPTQEEEAEMFELLIEHMKNTGFNQYEISNFAKPDYESQHNLVYWNNKPYYGIGAGAHSYVNGQRITNAGPIKHYMSLIKEKGVPYTNIHPVTQSEAMEEEVFLGLRKIDGVSKSQFFQKFGVDLNEIFLHQIDQLKQKGLLVEAEDYIKLSKNGIFLGNEVFQEFIEVI